MAYTKPYAIDAGPGGDAVNTGVNKCDLNIDDIYSALNGYAAAIITFTNKTIHGGSITDDITVTDGKKIDGRDLSVDGAKLDGIDADAVSLDTVKSDSDVADALSKKHSQNADSSMLLVAALSSNQTASGSKVSLTAGESFAFGEVGYIKSDGKVWKAKADAATTMPVRYVALGAISADASGTFLRSGIVRNDAWNWTVGGESGLIYASAATAGAMTQTAPSGSGQKVQVIGHALTADIMDFNPESLMGEVA